MQHHKMINYLPSHQVFGWPGNSFKLWNVKFKIGPFTKFEKLKKLSSPSTKPQPKNQQSPKRRKEKGIWTQGWHYNHRGHYPTPPTPNFQPWRSALGKEFWKGKSLSMTPATHPGGQLDQVDSKIKDMG